MSKQMHPVFQYKVPFLCRKNGHIQTDHMTIAHTNGELATLEANRLMKALKKRGLMGNYIGPSKQLETKLNRVK